MEAPLLTMTSLHVIDVTQINIDKVRRFPGNVMIYILNILMVIMLKQF